MGFWAKFIRKNITTHKIQNADAEDVLIKKFTFIKTQQFGKLINHLSKQKMISSHYWSIYSVSINDHIIKYHTDYEKYDYHNDGIINIIYDMTNQIFILNIINVKNMIHNLALADNYMFIPVYYVMPKQAGNYALLLFDKKRLAVYLVDPNGQANYYNAQIRELSTQVYIDRLFEKYLFEMNKCGCVYHYIHNFVWNPLCYDISNKTTTDSLDNATGYNVLLLLYIIAQIVKTELSLPYIYTQLYHLKNKCIVMVGFAKKMNVILVNTNKL